MVQPYLEYCERFWSPYFQKDMAELEKYRREQSKWLEHHSSEETLKSLGLVHLRKEMTKGGHDRVFEIVKRVDKVIFFLSLNPKY